MVGKKNKKTESHVTGKLQSQYLRCPSSASTTDTGTLMVCPRLWRHLQSWSQPIPQRTGNSICLPCICPLCGRAIRLNPAFAHSNPPFSCLHVIQASWLKASTHSKAPDSCLLSPSLLTPDYMLSKPSDSKLSRRSKPPVLSPSIKRYQHSQHN